MLSTVTVEYVAILLSLHIHTIYSFFEIGTLRFKVPATGSRCFYQMVEKDGDEIHWEFLVESGGNFDICWSLTTPNEQQFHQRMLSFGPQRGREENQTEPISLENLRPGLYTICFDNVLSTKEDKVMILRDDLDWLDQEHEREELKEYWKDKERYAKKDQMDDMVVITKELLRKLDQAERQQEYLKTRMNRHFYTLGSTQHRLNVAISCQCLVIFVGVIVELLWIKGWFKRRWNSFRV